MNPLLTMLNTAPMMGKITQMSQLYQMMRSGGNPMMLMNQMVQSNPQLQPIISALNSGDNPEQVFYNECQKRNVDPKMILNQLKG